MNSCGFCGCLVKKEKNISENNNIILSVQEYELFHKSRNSCMHHRPPEVNHHHEIVLSRNEDEKSTLIRVHACVFLTYWTFVVSKLWDNFEFYYFRLPKNVYAKMRAAP